MFICPFQIAVGKHVEVDDGMEDWLEGIKKGFTNIAKTSRILSNCAAALLHVNTIICYCFCQTRFG